MPLEAPILESPTLGSFSAMFLPRDNHTYLKVALELLLFIELELFAEHFHIFEARNCVRLAAKTISQECCLQNRKNIFKKYPALDGREQLRPPGFPSTILLQRQTHEFTRTGEHTSCMEFS